MARSLSGCVDEAQRPRVLDFGEHGEGLAGNELVGRHTFKSQQAAVDALNALIRERSKGTHTQTQMCGGFGIDIVIDEDTANDMRIVDWKIQKQYKTRWELVDEMEASE